MATKQGSFVWYELMTTDLAAAEKFYGTVADWTLNDAGMPGMRYTLAQVGDHRIGGLMTLPEEVKAMGGMPCWSGYVAVDDVDAMTQKVRQAGGKVHREPDDIPGVGRFSVVADPQGAVFLLFKGQGTPQDNPSMGTPGTFGWHELHTSDWKSAFEFYEKLFGWKKTEAMDMGEMGTYQIFATNTESVGGMMNNAQAPKPFWLYYVFVSDIDATQAKITQGGGKVLFGPQEVPGGMWIIQGTDPQGIMFAVVGPRK